MRRLFLFISIQLFFVQLTQRATAQGSQAVNNSEATTAIRFPGTGADHNWTNSMPGIGLFGCGTRNTSSFTSVNTGSSAVTATITATPVQSGFVYETNEFDGTVSVINAATNTVVATVTVGNYPECIAISPDGSRIYVLNYVDSETISVINAATNTVIETITDVPHAYRMALTPDGATLYVVNFKANTISVISTATYRTITTISAITPIAITVSPDGKSAYVIDYGGNIDVINTSTNNITGSVPNIGDSPIALTISPDGTRVYVDNFDGDNVAVINTATNAIVSTIPVGVQPGALCISPDGSKLYVTNQDSGTISIINTSTNVVTNTITLSPGLMGIAVSADGTLIYVTNNAENTVSVINTTSYSVVTNISVGTGPWAIAAYPSVAAASPASITPGIVSGTIVSCQGTASAIPSIQQFTISGSGLTGAVAVTAPPNFEVSLSSGSNYANSVTLTETSSLANTTIYVRSGSAAPAGNISGNVIISSPGATSQNVAVTGYINALPTVNAVPPQTFTSGTTTTAIDFTGTGNTYTWVNNTPGIGLAASGTGAIPSFTTVNTGSSPVTASVTVTPGSTSRAYITSGSVNNVSVINTDNNSVSTTIPVGTNPWGVAISPDGGFVYVTNLGSNSVSAINASTNTVAATINVGREPSGIVVSPDGSRVYVTQDGGVAVIDASTNTVITTIPGSANPFGLSFNPQSGLLYVANLTLNSISVINTATNTVSTTIALGNIPGYLAFSPDGSLLYVANIFANTVSVINTSNNSLIATIPVGTNPECIALSADGSRAYVTNDNGGGVSVINTATNTVITNIPAGAGPIGISISPDGSKLYVTSQTTSVLVFSTATYALLSTIQVGQDPIAFGNFISPGTGCSGTPVTFTIRVNPKSATPPAITVGAKAGTISACAGTASASPNIQQFTVSGSNLTGDIAVAAPTGFEVSLTPASGYGSAVTLNQSGGVVSNVVIYVRSSSSAPTGGISGNLILTSAGASSQDVAVTGNINPLPTVNPVAPQTFTNGIATIGINFTGTANNYTWVNNTPGIGLPATGAGNITPFTAVNVGTTVVKATVTVTPVKTGYVYMANAASNTVSVINTLTNAVVATVTVGEGPTCVAVSADGSHVYVGNGLNISVISTATNTVTATISTVGAIAYLATSPDGRKLYMVSDVSPKSIYVFSTASNSLINSIVLTTVADPGDLVISADSKLIYLVDQAGYVDVMNAGTGQIVTTVQVGTSPYDITISPDGSLVYVANSGTGTVSVINTSTNTAVATIPVGASPEGLVVSPDGSRLYVANQGSNTVSVINTATNSVIATLAVGSGTWGISVTSDGTEVYVDETYDNSVAVISTATNTVTATLKGFSSPFSTGSFISPGSGCSGAPTTFTITVKPAATASPVIVTGAVTGSISACAGTASASPNIQQFTVLGSNLTGNITATAPTGFEVSLAPGSGYGESAVLTPAGESVSSTVIYVCSSATASNGNISGNVTLTAAGATSQDVAVTGTVNAYLTVNTVPPQTLISGTATQAVNFAGTGNSYGWVNDTPGIGIPVSGTGNIPSFTAVNTGSSPVVATVTVTPQRPGVAYISNSISNNVTAINTLTNTVVATIPVGSAPLGVAVSPDNTRVYIANSLSNTVSVINTTTNTVIATIPVGQMPQAVSVSADGSRVYVCNLNNSVSVIASASNTLIATIEGFIGPFALAASTSGNILYVSNASGTVSVVNTATNTIQQTITVGGNFSDPYQIVVSPDGSHVYVTSFSSNTVSVINTATYSVVNTIPVGMGPGGMAISPDGNFVYVSCYYGGNVTVINTNTDAIVQTININSPVGISVTADGKNVYVVNNPSSVAQGTPATVSVISMATNSVVATVPVGAGPNCLGNFIAAGIKCTTPGTFTITVNPAANNITAGPVTGSISACEGTASVSPNIQQFTVSTSGLTGNITATAPTGFELSLSAGSGYSSIITLTETGSTVVYVRSAATAPAGDISGDVTLTSAGVTIPDVVVTGVINALPTVNAVPNQTVNSGAATTAIDFSGTGDSYTWVNDTPGIGLPAAGTGDIASFAAINTGSSPLTATVTVTPGSDANAYVPASSSPGTVSVISVATNTLVQTITVGAIPTSVSISPDGGRVYITNSSSNTVSVINTATNTVVATIAVGNDPDAVVVSPDNTRVFVANLNDGTVSVITTAFNTVTATIHGFQQPRALAISPGGGTLYVCNTNDISVINTATDNVEAIITGESAWEIAISPDGSMIYITTLNDSVIVINTTTNSVVATIPVGQTPEGLALSPDGSVLYVACFGAGNVTAIDTKTNTIITTISVPGGPITLSVGADGNSLFVEENTSSAVAIINTGTGKIIATIPVGPHPIAFGNFVSTGSGCSGIPVTFTITVNPGPLGTLIIPNTFTPNGDGINDTWDIKYLNAYTQCTVQIFNRWGQNVYSSIGYGIPWDGKYKGAALPSGTYYYVINLQNNTQLLSGFVAIIR